MAKKLNEMNDVKVEFSSLSHAGDDLKEVYKPRFKKSTEAKEKRRDTKAAQKGKNTGRWTEAEHERFLECIELYGP